MGDELKEWEVIPEEAKKYKTAMEEFFKEKKKIGEKERVDIAEIAKVRYKKEEELLKYQNVVGLATGYKIKENKVLPELCLQILVEQKVDEKKLASEDIIPKEIEGIKTDVIVTGKIEPLSYKGRYRPAFPGVSIGHYKVTAGTFGCLVYDKQEYDVLILSNNHVLANSNNAKINDPILQPGKHDGGVRPGDEIARLRRFVQLLPTYNLVDAAVAAPIDMSYVIPNIPRLGVPRGTADVLIGTQVQKVGRTTQYTTGRVTAMSVTLKVPYSTGVYQFRDQMLTTSMSARGDSGSLVLDSYRRAVGLLFSGSSCVTVFNRISNVLRALKVGIMKD